jgi:hypothetical protein
LSPAQVAGGKGYNLMQGDRKVPDMKNIQVLTRVVGVGILIVCILSDSACVKVPAQAVVLSRTVGERLPDLQASHEAFVSAYFQLSRERVEDFLDQRWIPTFLGNFVAKSDLMQKLENVEPFTEEQNTRLKAKLQQAGISPADQEKIIQAVNNAFGDPDRGKLMLLFSEAALKQIQLKRKSLLNPIDEQERQSLSQLRTVYAQVQQAQDAVTAHLSSIRNVTDEQDQVLARLGLLKSRDTVIEKALETNQEIMGILDAGKDPEKTVEELEGLVKKLQKPAVEESRPNQ